MRLGIVYESALLLTSLTALGSILLGGELPAAYWAT